MLSMHAPRDSGIFARRRNGDSITDDGRARMVTNGSDGLGRGTMLAFGGRVMVKDAMRSLRAEGSGGGPARCHVDGSTVASGGTRKMMGGGGGGLIGRRMMRIDVTMMIVEARGGGFLGHARSPRARARDAKSLHTADALSAAGLCADGAWADDSRAPNVNPRSPGSLSLGRTQISACLRRSLRRSGSAGGPLIL